MDKIICQECSCVIIQEPAVKVSGEGFICAYCLEKLLFEDGEDA